MSDMEIYRKLTAHLNFRVVDDPDRILVPETATTGLPRRVISHELHLHLTIK
jgi:hypothetical protein